MRKVLSSLWLALLILVIFSTLVLHFFKFTPEYPVVRMDKGWTVTYHNQQYLNTNLESMSTQVGTFFSRGDVINLDQAKPLKEMNVPFPYLFFKTQYCAYEVYLDGRLINSKYLDMTMDNRFIGVGYNFVPLPRDYAGKRLSLMLFVGENATKADIISPMMGNFDDLYRELGNTALFSFATAMFLMLFGAVFLIISLLFSVRSSGISTQILCSLLTITLGFWILTAYDVADIIFVPSVSTTIAYCFLYMIVPLMYLILWNLHRRQTNKVVVLLTVSSFLFSFIFILLHLINLVHINHFQYPYFLIAAVGLVVLLCFAYMDVKAKARNSSTRILMIGLSVLALTLVIYAVAALSRRFVDYRQSFLLANAIPFGAMFFSFMQLLNYFIYMTHSFAQKKEYAALTKIAYIDNLTGLPNRASCDEKMVQFAKLEEDFCILSLDLNGLKEVNDNAGHPAGDRLLKSFADTLADVFRDVGFCTRIGGDEFLVLIETIDKDTLDSLLKELDERLLKLDEEDQEINHSVSYGYAFRSETDEKDTHAVTMLADQRMYNYKREHYAHLMAREQRVARDSLCAGARKL